MPDFLKGMLFILIPVLSVYGVNYYQLVQKTDKLTSERLILAQQIKSDFEKIGDHIEKLPQELKTKYKFPVYGLKIQNDEILREANAILNKKGRETPFSEMAHWNILEGYFYVDKEFYVGWSEKEKILPKKIEGVYTDLEAFFNKQFDAVKRVIEAERSLKCI